MSQFTTRAIGVSVLAAAMTAGLAFADGPYDDGRELAGAYDARRPHEDGWRGREGIDAARRAHYRRGERRAERLDGACEDYVTIEHGETLSDIAEYCDAPVAVLLDVNPQIGHPRYIPAGELIRIPDVYGDIYEGRRRLSYHGRHYSADYLPAGALEADQSGRVFYRVRRGDTLAEISAAYETPPRVIASLNPHLRPRSLDVGDRVYLPDYAAEAPAARVDRHQYGNWDDKYDPIVSIYPNEGPRDGEIMIVGEGFRQGGEVAIYIGEDQNQMTRIRVVEADGDGRIREKLRLPNDYRHEKAYWAARPEGGDYYLSEAYGVDRRWEDYGERRRAPDYRSSLSVVERREGSGDVALVVNGFPPKTVVSIYAGEEDHSVELIAKATTDFRGEAQVNARTPRHVGGERAHFVAIVDDRRAGRFEARASEYIDDRRFRGYARSHADHEDLRRAALLEDPSPSFFGRLKRQAHELLAAADFVDGPTVVYTSGVPGGSGELVGVLLDSDGQCAWLRDHAGAYHRLDGRLQGFGDGDRIVVSGDYDGRGQSGGYALRVARADWAP